MKTACPFCQQHYEITQEHLGAKIQCQSCGNAFLVEELEEKLMQRSPCRGGYFYTYLMGGLFTVFSAGFLILWAQLAARPGDPNYLIYTLCILGIVFGICCFIWVELETKTTIYTLTSKKVIKEWGVFGRMKQEMRICDIRNVNAVQDILGRISGFSHISIAAISDQEHQMELDAVRDAEEFISALDRQISIEKAR